MLRNHYIDIYLYTYCIITVFVVTKSLFGYVSNQVQYNMDSDQYLGLSDYIIILINKYILDTYMYIFNRWKNSL